MDSKSNIELSKALPFHACSFFTVSQLFKSNKNNMLEKLENNNFSKTTIDMMYNIPKDNYTCGYFDEQGLHNLSNKHAKDNLKIFHANIESLNSKGAELTFFLSCLTVKFDIICLTETRATTIGILDKHFPEYHIYIDNPKTAIGIVLLLTR